MIEALPYSCLSDIRRKPRRAKLLSVWLLLLLVYCAGGQDIHFSQFNFSPLNQNPANTNLFDGDYRFTGNYKNQWPTVPVRFNTVSAAAEMNFIQLKNNDRFGGGLMFYYDKAGDSRFSSTQVALSLSYIKTLDKKFHHVLSLGVQAGLVNRSFSYEKLYFDNQWNGDVFNPNTPVDESFAKTRFNFFDLGAGIAYKWTKAYRTSLTVGLGIMHLNQPRQSFYNDNSIKLNPRFTAHARAQVKVARRWDILPEVMYQRQDTKQEFDFGMHAKYYLPVKIPHTVALNLGFYTRPVDAGWLMMGVDFDQLQVNLSYDINFSKLQAASRNNGGFEVSVMYILAKIKKINKPGAVCPAFL